MARIALDLSQFNSAGVYTVEIDNSERILVTTQALRLFVGFSAQGPVNTPVFIRSTRDLETFFGPIDTKLERKGSFFHRSIKTGLLTSPVFALNLFDASTADEIGFIGLGLDTAVEEDASIYVGTTPKRAFVDFFDRTRFWKADAERLQKVVELDIVNYDDKTPLLQFANVGNKKVSIIVRKTQGLKQYDVYAKDWYGSQENIPYDWIRPFDYIRDYFIQVIVIDGDWTNYGSLTLDPYFSEFFTEDGIKPNMVQRFINSGRARLIASWSGSIIPDFVNKVGGEEYIETIVNKSTPITGILMNIDHEALDQLNWNGTDWVLGDSEDPTGYEVDLLGHNLISKDSDFSLKFLSYDIDVSISDFIVDVSATMYPDDTTNRKFYIDAEDGAEITIGSLIEKDETVIAGTIPGVTRVINKYFETDYGYIVETAEPIKIDGGSVKVQKPIDHPDITKHYKIITLDGLNIKNRHLPGFDRNGAPNVEEGIEKIYGMLEDSGIMRGLTNSDMINFRYIVDTMAYGLRPELGGKRFLSKLAKARGKCTAIINAPSISQFAMSANPAFSQTVIGESNVIPIFDTEYIPLGGNPDMPRSFRFSLPNEENGSKYCGVFGPFLRYNNGGKTFKVPPAADVANAYIKKFLGGDPFAIIANKNGVLSNPSLVGVEYMIDKYDRDYLEPFGYNSIIERPATGEVMIYSNTTAFQDVKSDMNNLHVRELLNTLEIQIEEILKNYVFTFNNPVTRLNIVNSITSVLEVVKDAGALIKYEVVMDDTNNSAELIAEGFGIVDVQVWVTGALTKIVNRITLNKSEGISSGGFIF